jgi:nitroreductase
VEAIEAILTRRSIRKYTDLPVPDATVQELLEAAMSAPSAGNQQPWQFVVIRDRQTLQKVPSVHPYASMVPGAALAILVCGDLHLETHQGYWVQDCSAATQNLLLAAHAQGLGAVWLGVYPREDRVSGLRSLLRLPEHVVPLALIAIGYPDQAKPRAERYDPARVHKDRW